uniref:PPR_long domain-containing protein n=1 Tax=Angiostrongylus cantonensis TaxID=6313 RepID=A0A158P687_ANGCA
LFFLRYGSVHNYRISLRNSGTVVIPYCSGSWSDLEVTDENKLINRSDFRGVPAKNTKRDVARFPETVLSQIQESLRRNYRISASTVFLDVVKRLEEGDEAFISTLKRSSERWLPMLLRACGKAASNVPNSSRQQILARLWNEVNSRGMGQARNFFSFSFRNLSPDQHTFQLLLTSLARSGDIEGCRTMVYEMARRGFLVDNICNDALVYCFAVRGHHAKADSLAEALRKYGADAVSSSQGACAKAAAARADLNRLRTVLRRAVVGEKRKLILSASDILETIWLLSEKSLEGDGAEFVNLTEQMLNYTCHGSGFFRLLIREIETHIMHQHYYIAVALLEDTNRVSDCLKSQQKSLFLNQIISQLSRQVIRNEVNVAKVNDIANRVHNIYFTLENVSVLSPRIHDDLLFAAIMYKEFSIDKRMEYVSALVDMVDRERTRHHLVLPLTDDVEDRLKLIFRCCNLGYKDLSQHDIFVLSHLLLKPVYGMSTRSSDFRISKLDKVARILRSYGVSNDSIWQTIYAWWRDQTSREKHMENPQLAKRPSAGELQGLVFLYYKCAFCSVKGPIFPTTYDRLKKFVDDRDSSKVYAFVSSYGWPGDTNFEEIIPDLLDLYLNHEEWGNVKKMLISLSSQSGKWQKEDDPSYSPIKNYHLLQILRRLSNEGEEISLRKIINYSYELRRLFPGAVANYDTFFNTLHEYNKLFGRCFERLPNPSVEKIDECIDLLRTLNKLEVLLLHPSETLTSVFISNEAVNTWMKFQSSLYCSNGIVALLRYSLMQKSDNSKLNIQYVLHKAQNFLPKSRVHCLYVAVLVNNRFFCSMLTSEIDPLDCIMAMRFMNALKAKMVDEEFIRQFTELCLKYTTLSGDIEAVRQLQADWIRTCEQRRLAPLALRLYDLFKRYGIDLQDNEKLRLWNLIGEHEIFAKQWIYEPHGFLRISADDDLIQNSDIGQIKRVLQDEISTSRSLAL